MGREHVRPMPGASPDPRPLEHPLWPGFKAHVVAAKLNPLLIASSQEFVNHGREVWESYLAGARATGWEEEKDVTEAEAAFVDGTLETEADSCLRL